MALTSLCVCVAEIKAVPDLNLESDRKLDNLESFLGKLNSKGQSCSSHCRQVHQAPAGESDLSLCSNNRRRRRPH